MKRTLHMLNNDRIIALASMEPEEREVDAIEQSAIAAGQTTMEAEAPEALWRIVAALERISGTMDRIERHLKGEKEHDDEIVFEGLLPGEIGL